MTAEHTQVLIVGAGPVGLTAALRLDAMGINCIVVEAGGAVAEDLRASTFHPPTLDMLAQYGVTDTLVSQGRLCPTWQIRVHDTHEKAEFDLSVLEGESDHPYRLQCEQSKLCKILVERLKHSSHADIRFGHKLVDFVQDDDHVAITVENAHGTAPLAASYLIAADGASSLVRQKLTDTFDGVTYPENTILATTRFDFENHLPGLSNVNYIWAAHGTFSLLHLPDRWRCSLYPDKDQSLEDATTPDAIEEKLQRIVPRDERYDVLDMRVYRVHMRIVNDYRFGRIFLAGDAAHINSPSGGMGMNGGIHDAFALTDLLKSVLDGAPDKILDSYTLQRRPIAEAEILKQADKNRSRMQERDPEKRRALFADLQAITNDHVRMKDYLMRSSMITGLRRSREISANIDA